MGDDIKDTMRARYDAAKAAKTGSDIECPACGTLHRKTMHAKVFCSNGRTRGGNCKDRYWNIIEPERLRRAQKYLNR